MDYVGGTTATSAGAATYDVPLTGLTGGIGSAPQAGDLVIVASGFVSQGSPAGDPSVASPGYTEAYRGFSDSTRDSNLSVCYKHLTTAETSVTVRGNPDAIMASCAVMHVWRGVDAASPLDVPAVGATGIGSRNADSPAIQPVSEGAVVLSIGGTTSGNPTSYSEPSGYENVLTAIYDPDRAYQLGIASKAWSGSGSEDPPQWTGGSATAESWVAVALALRPGAAGATLDRAASADASTAVAAARTLRRDRGTAIAAASSAEAIGMAFRGRGASVTASSTVAAAARVSGNRATGIVATSAASAAATIIRARVAGASAASSVTAAPAVTTNRSAAVSAVSSVSAGAGGQRNASASVAATSAASAIATRFLSRGAIVTAVGAAQAAGSVSRGRGGVVIASSAVTAARRVVLFRAANAASASVITATAVGQVAVTRYAYPGEVLAGRLVHDQRDGALLTGARAGLLIRQPQGGTLVNGGARAGTIQRG